MRVFSQGQLAQGLARALVAVFVWSALLSGVAVLPAGAQVVTRTAAGQSVAVLPFQNLSGYCPDTFGQIASDAVAVELRDRLLLDVLPNPEVTLQMKNLGMATPLGSGELVRLATELEVSMIVTGEVRAAGLVVEKGNRYAEVTLGVLLFDRTSEGFINGALVTARSPSSLEAAGDDLITKALKQATFQAAQEMKTRPTITAMVLWSKEGRIFTNTGTRGGVQFGMQMAAIRGGQRIAVVKITSTEPTGSYASIVAGSDLRTGDHLRALYELPEATQPPYLIPRIKRESKGWERPLIIAGILLGLSSYSTTSRDLLTGNEAARNFKASNLSNSVGNMTAMGIPLLFGVGYLTWTEYPAAQRPRIALYEIWRDQDLVWVNVPDFDEPYVFDQWYGDPGSPGGSVLVVSVDLDFLSGNLFPASGVASWDGVDPDNWGDFVAQFPAGIIASQYNMTYGLVLYPPIPGVRYNYRVRPVIIENHQLPGSPFSNWEFVYDEPRYTSPSSVCTIVAPPATDQALVIGNVATYLFYGPVGADEMVLQITRDTGGGPSYEFVPGQMLERVITGLASPPPGFGGFTMQSIQVTLTDMQTLPGTSDVFWWRVGARNRSDATPPRPWPLNQTTENGWVWSWPVNRLELSSVARAALTREQQDRLSQFRSNRVMKVRTRNDNRPLHVPR